VENRNYAKHLSVLLPYVCAPKFYSCSCYYNSSY
jgi:hypothetical protein